MSVSVRRVPQASVGAGVYDFGVAGAVYSGQVAGGALMVRQRPEDFVDVVIFGRAVPLDLFIGQHLIHRRPPEVAVGDFAVLVETEGDLADCRGGWWRRDPTGRLRRGGSRRRR